MATRNLDDRHVLSMSPVRFGTLRNTLALTVFSLRGLDTIPTWFRLILREGEQFRPLTHRGSLGGRYFVSVSVATVVHLVGLHPESLDSVRRL